MKAAVVILLMAFASVECKKLVLVSKHANVDFINMESGGGFQPARAPAPTPIPPKSPVQAPPSSPVAPVPVAPVPVAPPKPAVTTSKPVPVVPVTQSVSKPVQPQQPKPNQGGATTPGPGTVKQLVTFYDSQGKASNIRPYSYSEAVKKGK